MLLVTADDSCAPTGDKLSAVEIEAKTASSRLHSEDAVSIYSLACTYPFSVRGQTILLDSCSLAAALARLPKQTQEEIFLYYFQHLTQKEIGEQSGWTRSTIGRHIQLALKRMKEEMEVLSHE